MSPLSPVHAALRLARSAVGLALGVVDAVLDVVRHEEAPASTDAAASDTDDAGGAVSSAAPDAVTEPAPQRRPAATPRPVTTEPKPMASDDWEEELMEELADEYGGDADAGAEGSLFGDRPAEPDVDQPVLDPAVAKGVRKESETMRRAAEREPEDTAGE